jgi:hypothetical protein
LILAALPALAFGQANPALAEAELAQRPWGEVSTAHFAIYSCGPIGEVYQLAARLELFHRAYAQLTGTQALPCPPVVVLAFPNSAAMQPFLPRYDGAAVNAAGFFQRGVDENLIVLALSEPGSSRLDLRVVFHEYAHFLFRQNDAVWPLWLKEGMAEIYSTFDSSGRYASIAAPIDQHLQLLAREPLPPLRDLFAVGHNSPQYHEAERQGMFYAESWLLTHFLMSGENPQYTARFGQFTTLLRQGWLPEQAFTNSLRTTLPRVDYELNRYLARGLFRPIPLVLATNISAPVPTHVFAAPPAEVNFRLGDELLRVGNGEASEPYFVRAHQLAPASPRPEEGLGLLADQQGRRDQTLRHLKAAIDLGSENYLVYYLYARERYRAMGDAQDRHTRLTGPPAAEIRGLLERAIRLMPDFAPAHELLGFFEMVQGDDLERAKAQLVLAMQLEPDNQSYLISLAQLLMRAGDAEAARRTLQPLLGPAAPADLRNSAQAILAQLADPKTDP